MAKKKSKLMQNNTKGKSFDFILFVTVLIMLSFGIVMVLSASAPSSLAETGNAYKYVKTQLISAGLGIILMYIISKIDYRKYLKVYKLIYIVSIILIALVPIIGKEVNGAKRWLKIGPLQFQPSEVAKIGLIIFYATILTKNKDTLKRFWKGFIVSYLWLIPVFFILLLFQKHLSATILIFLIISIMMIMAGCKFMYFAGCTVTVGSLGLLAIKILSEYSLDIKNRFTRIISFTNPWADAKGAGWQVIQSLYAIGSGGLFGVGLRAKQTKIFIHTRTT